MKLPGLEDHVIDPVATPDNPDYGTDYNTDYNPADFNPADYNTTPWKLRTNVISPTPHTPWVPHYYLGKLVQLFRSCTFVLSFLVR